MQQLLNKAQGKLQSAENLLRAKSDERSNAEELLKNQIHELFVHNSLAGFTGIKEPFTEIQKRNVSDLSDSIRRILALDKELSNFLNEYRRVDDDVRSLKEKINVH